MLILIPMWAYSRCARFPNPALPILQKSSVSAGKLGIQQINASKAPIPHRTALRSSAGRLSLWRGSGRCRASAGTLC